MAQFAVMNIEKGEQIVIALVSGHIPGTGRYKFLAKKKKNGEYEWAHFTESPPDRQKKNNEVGQGITGIKKMCTGEK
jgi:hypothetical protein